MRPSKLRTRRTFYLVMLAGLTLGLGFAAYPLLKRSVTNSTAPPDVHATAPHAPAEVTPKSASAGLPVRLQIPKLDVDAALEQVGIMPSGELGSPKGPTTVAWFAHGPRPGDVGSAIVNGHFGYKSAGRSLIICTPTKG